MHQNPFPCNLACWRGRLLALVFLLLSALVANQWLLLENQLLESIPESKLIEEISINGPPGYTTTLGWELLGQRPGAHAAENRHIEIHRDEKQGWMISNKAKNRKIYLKYKGYGGLFLRRWELKSGDMITVNETHFTVGELTPSSLILTASSGVRYSVQHEDGGNATVQAEDSSRQLTNAGCGIGGWGRKLRQWIRNIKSFFQSSERTLIDIGGGVDCQDRIAVPGVKPNSLRITYKNGVLFLAPGRNGDSKAVKLSRENGEPTNFSEIERPLIPRDYAELQGELQKDHLEYLIIGRTHYKVHVRPDSALQLIPISKRFRFFDLGESGPPHGFIDSDASLLDYQRLDKTVNSAPEGVTLTPSAQPNSTLSLWNLRTSAPPLGVFFTILMASFLIYLKRRINQRRDPHPQQKNRLALVSTLALAINSAFATFFTTAGWFDMPSIESIARADLGLLIVINWCITSIAIALAPERRWHLYAFWLFMSLLFVFGALTMELLNVGATKTHFAHLDAKHLASLSLAFLATTFVMHIQLSTWRSWVWRLSRSTDKTGHLARILPMAILFLVFIAWLFLGKEEGLGPFQPMEVGKYIAIIVLSILISNFDYRRQFSSFFSEILKYLGILSVVILIYSFLFALIPGLKSDYSPILILFIVSMSLVITTGVWLITQKAYRWNVLRNTRALPPDRKRLRQKYTVRILLGRWSEVIAISSVLIALAIASAIVMNHWEGIIKTHHPLDNQLSAIRYDTKDERLAVRYSIHDHPEMGSQLSKSLSAIMATPCYEWEKDFLPNAVKSCTQYQPPFGLNPPSLMSVPVLQNDFVAAFIIQRFGYTGASLLLFIQISIIWIMIDAAISRYRWKGGDYTEVAVRQVLCFITIGGALLLVVHWGISWGNSLGIWPVMGQPMTWIASANSHLWLMATPILTSSMILMRLNQHNHKPMSATTPPPNYQLDWRPATKRFFEVFRNLIHKH